MKTLSEQRLDGHTPNLRKSFNIMTTFSVFLDSFIRSVGLRRIAGVPPLADRPKFAVLCFTVHDLFIQQ